MGSESNLKKIKKKITVLKAGGRINNTEIWKYEDILKEMGLYS